MCKKFVLISRLSHIQKMYNEKNGNLKSILDSKRKEI